MAHIADHLSVEELGRRARSSAEACAARHYQAIWLLAQGQPVPAVAAVTGFGRAGWSNWPAATTSSAPTRWATAAVATAHLRGWSLPRF